MSTIARLAQRGLARPPAWLPDNTHYETLMGSVAYGVESGGSDWDVYGFCIPPKELVFPHLQGEIAGFGTPVKRFEQFEQHHIHDPTENAGKGRTYDVTVFSIVKYFQLCMECNPNLIDSLFTPRTCVLHTTRIGERVRESRKLFLHKGAWPRFKGYAHAQLHKMRTKAPQPGSKRAALREEFGMDVKFGYHVVRLLNEIEQILLYEDLDLQQNNEQLKAIRRGEVTEEQIREYAAGQEKRLEALYHQSKLPAKPDEGAISQLLIDCLEDHYGSLGGVVVRPDAAQEALPEIQAALDRAASRGVSMR
jgi:uncharacterized protein